MTHKHPGAAAPGVPPRVILASGSARRKELLAQMGVPCDVIPPDLDEDAITERVPARLVAALARAKAERVRSCTQGAPTRWILAADTVVAVGEQILGKPGNRAEAETMIRTLSGREHRVVTGVAVWPPSTSDPTVRTAETTVWFDTLTEPEISAYLQTDDWRDVAGGYRIQNRAALHIGHISGSYSNVVGLPIHLVYNILTGHGYQGL